MKFNSLGLSPAILSALEAKGYREATPIQEKAIPSILEGKDVMAAAQTGTGKTAGFTLPILQLLSQGGLAKPNHVRALILTPTRELAAQVSDSVEAYGKGLSLRSSVVFGGVKINPQMMRLRKGVDVLVATPGRLLDLYGQNAIKFSQLEILVLDEADRMLDMGFIRDIKKIMALLPKKRQSLLFSATFSNDIRALAKELVHNPAEISVAPANTTAARVEQLLHPVDKKQKSALLLSLIVDQQWMQVLVFTRTKHGANKLTRYLEGGGLKAAAIHGNKSQGARTKALANFKSGEVQVLVATDIAARGLDIDQLPQVVNFDLPSVAEDYVHRIGRTGRAGAAGQAVSLVCADEHKILCDIERVIQKEIPRQYHDDFRPAIDLPTSLPLRAPKRQRPKKQGKPTAGASTNNRGSHNSSNNHTSNNHTSNNNTNNKNTSNNHTSNKNGGNKNGGAKPGDAKKVSSDASVRKRVDGPKPVSNRTQHAAKPNANKRTPKSGADVWAR